MRNKGKGRKVHLFGGSGAGVEEDNIEELNRAKAQRLAARELFNPQDPNKSRQVKRRGQGVDEWLNKDNDDMNMDQIHDDLNNRRTKAVLEEMTEETSYTIIAYFTNIIFLVLTMLIYYGLLIILIIALLIQLYDYHYNHEIFMDIYMNK